MVDLHTHTTCSDGSLSVRALLELASKENVRYLSITDHQNVDAYKELGDIETRKLFNGKIIPGVELFFKHGNISNEVLGYGIDIKKMAKLNKLTSKQLESEFLFLEDLYAVISKYDCELSNINLIKERMRKENLIAREAMIYDSLNRKALRSLGSGPKPDKDFITVKVADPQSEFYIKRKQCLDTLEQASTKIRKAGGLVFMAHAFDAGNDKDVLEMLDYAVNNKLVDGIEVYYKNFTKPQVQFMENYAKQHNLLISGGSDFHHVKSKSGNLTQLDFDIMPWIKQITFL